MYLIVLPGVIPQAEINIQSSYLFSDVLPRNEAPALHVSSVEPWVENHSADPTRKLLVISGQVKMYLSKYTWFNNVSYNYCIM